jgi:hypothetical protein
MGRARGDSRPRFVLADERSKKAWHVLFDLVSAPLRTTTSQGRTSQRKKNIKTKNKKWEMQRTADYTDLQIGRR